MLITDTVCFSSFWNCTFTLGLGYEAAVERVGGLVSWLAGLVTARFRDIFDPWECILHQTWNFSQIYNTTTSYLITAISRSMKRLAIAACITRGCASF